MADRIFAICKTLDAGYEYEKKAMAEAGIKVGDKIELRDALVGGFHTKVSLAGFEGDFNSVFFDFVDENGEEYDIYGDEDFQTYR